MRRAIVICLILASRLPAADPDVTISLANRQATAIPHRVGFTHTGGGNVVVQQSAPDTLVITMTGVAVAGGHPCKDSAAVLTFDLLQELEITINKKDVKLAQLSLEARLIGLLRSHACGGGSASITCPAQATISPCGAEAVSLAHLTLPGRTVTCGENLSINDQHGPVKVDLPAGKFVLHQQFAVQAAHPRKVLPCKTASAEFAPDPALDPLWISAYEPFKGVQKKEFGFQVTIKVSAAAPDPGRDSAPAR